MKTWRIEIEIQTGDQVTETEFRAVADKIADDAAERAGNEFAGASVIDLVEAGPA